MTDGQRDFQSVKQAKLLAKFHLVWAKNAWEGRSSGKKALIRRKKEEKRGGLPDMVFRKFASF